MRPFISLIDNFAKLLSFQVATLKALGLSILIPIPQNASSDASKKVYWPVNRRNSRSALCWLNLAMRACSGRAGAAFFPTFHHCSLGYVSNWLSVFMSTGPDMVIIFSANPVFKQSSLMAIRYCLTHEYCIRSYMNGEGWWLDMGECRPKKMHTPLVELIVCADLDMKAAGIVCQLCMPCRQG